MTDTKKDGQLSVDIEAQFANGTSYKFSADGPADAVLEALEKWGGNGIVLTGNERGRKLAEVARTGTDR